ncbi:MAG: HlyD family efflux transporter periplasmic adaptor subunit [Deltaproteobacteria bacterium]|nr:HlyD family efflux transporter periplasmic adaptor subunit [Deltaproteobacteria bacterium]
MRRFVIALAAVVLVLSALLFVRLRLQRAQAAGPSGGSGEIEGTQVDLSARISARVESQPVKKGASVKKGDLLLTLDCADTRAALAEAEARLGAAEAQAAAAGASTEASRRQREAAAAGQMAAKAQAEALAAQRDAAVRQAGRLDAVQGDVAVSSRDQTRASAEGLTRQTEAALAQARASEQQATAAGAQIRAAGAQAVAAEAQRRAAEASVARARLLADECRVVAPRDAVVEELPREPGELVAAGQVLVRLVDLAEVKAVFYLPNAELAAARPGGKAQVVADAWPGQVFEGEVRTVAVKAEFTPRNIQTRTDRDRLVYPVEVWVSNREGKLRPGMPVQVTLAGAER